MPIRCSATRTAAAALLAFGLAACADSASAPDNDGSGDGVASAVAAPGSIAPWQPVAGDVHVCKSNAERNQPVGLTGAFEVSAPAGSYLYILPALTISTLADTHFPDGSSEVTVECRKVFRLAEGVTGSVSVTVTETPLPGSAVARVFEYSTSNDPSGPGSFTEIQDFMPTPRTTPVSATVEVSTTVGAVIWFKNTPTDTPRVALQGCTPGYWRQSQHFDSWPAPYTPTTPFVDVFGEDAFPGLTLGDVVQLGGGGLNALGRHTVAALLNAGNDGVTYAYATPQDVIDAFQAVYPGLDYTYEQLKDAFAAENERGCPLN